MPVSVSCRLRQTLKVGGKTLLVWAWCGEGCGATPRVYRLFWHSGPIPSGRNMVEPSFRDLAKNCRQQFILHSALAFIDANDEYVGHCNTERKPCIRTARAHDSREKVVREQDRFNER
jgi:hypothetical protein